MSCIILMKLCCNYWVVSVLQNAQPNYFIEKSMEKVELYQFRTFIVGSSSGISLRWFWGIKVWDPLRDFFSLLTQNLIFLSCCASCTEILEESILQNVKKSWTWWKIQRSSRCKDPILDLETTDYYGFYPSLQNQ